MKLKSQSLPLYMWCFIVIQISSVTVSEASSSVPGGAGSNETNGTSTPGSVSDTNPSKLNAAVPTEEHQVTRNQKTTTPTTMFMKVTTLTTDEKISNTEKGIWTTTEQITTQVTDDQMSSSYNTESYSTTVTELETGSTTQVFASGSGAPTEMTELKPGSSDITEMDDDLPSGSGSADLPSGNDNITEMDDDLPSGSGNTTEMADVTTTTTDSLTETGETSSVTENQTTTVAYNHTNATTTISNTEAVSTTKIETQSTTVDPDTSATKYEDGKTTAKNPNIISTESKPDVMPTKDSETDKPTTIGEGVATDTDGKNDLYTNATSDAPITTNLTTNYTSDLSKYLSTSELVLLIGVSFASFLLILAALVILATTLVVVVRRKSDNMVVNLITVHNYGTHGDYESDTESVEGQSQEMLIVEETSNNEISVNIINDNYESLTNSIQNLERENEEEDAKIDLTETVTSGDITIENESSELISVAETQSEPRIVDYESLVKAKEGEQVVLSVNFTGIPKPTISWTFKGTKMEGDYATELGTDGSLMFFCVEPKHAGKYDFEVKNDLGTIQGSVSLVVQEEYTTQQAATDVVEQTTANSLESHPIGREKFREYVTGLHMLNDKAFEIQYKSLLSGEEGKQVSIGRSDDYRCLNRFRNITAYDDCRIVLEPIIGSQDYQHDYINASYVDGLSRVKMFIATQGPLPHTVIDFWRLVWQEKIKTIAMVTNLKEGMKVKCEQYWPDQGHDMQLGPYKVTTVEQQRYPYYIMRKLLLSYTSGIVDIDVSQEIVQYHFTSWPDHGVPECAGPILNYLRRIKDEHHEADQGPLLVHCSAGVGRTGTLIAIDVALSQASKEKQVDIPKIIVNMRRQRMKMVQTLNQYIFIHDAVLEALICGDTQIPSSDLRQAVERLKQRDEQNEGKTGFEQQFEVLEQLSLKPLEIARSFALMHSDKNRNNDFLPSDKWRVRLKGRSPDQDYINASYANGYKRRKGFIIAQSPMVSTAGDFVKMLYERECGVVVMLCGCEEGGVEMCAQYWPTAAGTIIKYGEFMVSIANVTEKDGITQRMITITDTKSDKAEHKVTQFQVDQWNAEGVCSNPRTLIDVFNTMTEIQKHAGNKPVIVHGSDTVSRVGVFCSSVNAIEMCKTEGVADVFQVVKALRIQKPGAVLTADQYQFIFDLTLLFLDSFSFYSNFN